MYVAIALMLICSDAQMLRCSLCLCNAPKSQRGDQFSAGKYALLPVYDYILCPVTAYCVLCTVYCVVCTVLCVLCCVYCWLLTGLLATARA
jgi:hypothetical protein